MKGNFNNLIDSETPVLVDFYADWCGPCKMQSPILADLAKELNGKLKVIKINVDNNQEVAARYQVRNIPTLMLFKKGNNVWRNSGVMDKMQLKQTLATYL